MNVLLWALQVIAALMYAGSGIMKLFMFDKISADVRSFGALPRGAWAALGVLELICVVALVAPAALHWHPRLVVLAASLLAVESLVFIWVHVQYGEGSAIVMSAVLGLVMAFVAYGRFVLSPIV
jgi:DoxX-like protein